MNELLILSSKGYPDSDSVNYGDCILIRTKDDFTIYDCGHELHAARALEYMDEHNIEKAKLVLSHNDSDHFNGIPKLLESNRISVIRTTLLLKHVDKILELIDDERKNKSSLKKQITETFDNIAKLSGAPIEDVYENPDDNNASIKVIGPDFNYMLNAVAKLLNTCESDKIDGETIINATSLQLEVNMTNYKVLLCGDCSFEAIEDKLQNYQCLQLPHHGKKDQAEAIWAKNYKNSKCLYLISDNTGNSNGGSDNLNTTGHIVINTKKEDVITLNDTSVLAYQPLTGKTLGR